MGLAVEKKCGVEIVVEPVDSTGPFGGVEEVPKAFEREREGRGGGGRGEGEGGSSEWGGVGGEAATG